MFVLKYGILLTLFMNFGEAERINAIPIYSDPPCNGTDYITSSFSPGLSEGHTVTIKKTLQKGDSVKIKLDMEALITVDKNLARLVNFGNNVYKIVLLNNTDEIRFKVLGPYILLPPYLISVKIKGEELCETPNFGYFERSQVGAEKRPDVPNIFCGQRKALNHLIVNGVATKPGDWPWHVAISRIERASLKYICGGTLVSNIYVVTAGHCATIRGRPVLPESLGVTLGKHKLFGGDANSQEREVNDVIVHEEFSHTTLDNDIALLKLTTTVEFNPNVQPACLWFDKAADKLPIGTVSGTVTGWGFDQTESLSTVLHEATMPMISDLDCIRSKPLFFSTLLNGKKFCAGTRNGTSACNGDSGGGFFVYMPYTDISYSKYVIRGAWYIRGIVSLSVVKLDTASCDPNEYTVFTDIAAYTEWIYDHMD